VNPRLVSSNFSRGELGPELRSRFDTDSYAAGLKKAYNVMVMKYGGVTKRPGTYYVDEVVGSGPHRLIPFQFGLDQSYALEFGNSYMSPLADGGRVQSGFTDYSIASPYPGSALAELDFEQTADTLYLAHLSYAPRKLLRAGHTSWSFATVAFEPSIAEPTNLVATATVPNTDAANGGDAYFPQAMQYTVTAINEDTGQESRTSNVEVVVNDLTLKRNYNELTWDAVTGADRYNVYKANNTQFFGYIGTTYDLTFTDDNIEPGLDRAPPENYNPFPGADDYPSTVTLFEQRSIWARSTNAPNGIWMSRTAQLENMDRSRPLRADDSLTIAITAGKVNAINQLTSTTSLLALTSDAIFTIDGDGGGGVILANSPPAARRQVGRGASRISPIVVDNVVFYPPYTGAGVRSLNYSFEIDGIRSSDVTIFSPHFFEGFEIVSWCYAQEPRSVVWAVRDDGKLLCFTWEQEQNVWGWTECETDGLVKSICAIEEDGEDRVYLIVERVIGGVTKTYVERMASATWDVLDDTCFMDCAISATFVTPRATFTGLSHLNGRTDVVGIVDGVPVTGLTVSGGSLTLPEDVGTARQVTFGLPYFADIETLPVRIQTEGAGSNVGRMQQPSEYALTFLDTGAVEVGIDADHLFPLKTRTDEAYGEPADLLTGDYTAATDNKAGVIASVFIRSSVPMPLTLLGVGIDVVVNG
jgi:hypothetical protein